MLHLAVVKNEISPEKAQSIRNISLQSDFRNAFSGYEKVQILLNSDIDISIQFACKLCQISTKTYYNIKQQIDKVKIHRDQNGPNQKLTNSEEKHILQTIELAQLNCDGLNGRAIREIASNLFYARTQIRTDFSRGWFYLFMERYKDEIGKKKCNSVDEGRGNISLKKVDEYINLVLEILPKIKDLRLFINMDECGFGKRTNFKKRRSCVYSKRCGVTPVWRGFTDNYHVSWVCAITAGGTYIKHMLITTRKNMDDDFDSTFLSNFADFTFAEKGYMKESNMIDWIRNSLIPYVLQVRSDINQDDHPVVLLLDNLEQHLTDNVYQELEKIAPYYLIPLPPHSSHICQPCDACIFSSAKQRYNELPYPAGKSKFTSKLLRIKKAIQQTLSEDSIVASWNHCGFDIEIKKGTCVKIELNEKFQEELRQTATSSVAQNS